jgi:methyl-accepting chemotaxis protein
MKWFSDLGTKVKLLLSFGILSAMLGVVGVVGLSAAAEANASVVTAYDRDMRAVDLTLRAYGERLEIGKDYRSGLLARDDRGREAALRDVDDSYRRLSDLFTEIRGTLVLQENIASLEAAKRFAEDYVRLAREAVHANATDHERATALLAEASPIGIHLGDALTRIVVLKKELAKHEEEACLERYAHSRNAVILVTLLAVGLALLFAFIAGNAIATPLGETVRVLERVAAGDLSVRLDLARKDEVGKMATALNASLESMRSTLSGVQDISGEVAAAAAQLASAAEQISSGTQEQAASLEETAASLEEISSTVKQNADNAQQAAQLSSGSRDAAERGGQVVDAAVAAMNEITKSSKKIADIITTIDEIAFQTNLLALNAAVEAARAGEQGRGFGVVAAEVRTLAQRTASAAKEIRGLIADSTSKVEIGTQQVNRSGETLGEIVRSVKRVTDMVSEIAAASREQNSGVEQVNTAVTQVDQVTQGNAAQTEELSATATSLSEKAGHLEQLVAAFELGSGTKKAKLAAPAPVAAPKRAVAHHPAAFSTSRTNMRPPASGARRSAAPMARVVNGEEEF